MQTNQPKYSIIVTSYNYAKYLNQCLESLAGQNYRSFEVIVVDDGSKDNSIDVINKYVKSYSNFYFYSHKFSQNEGLVSSVKLALSKCRGKYVCFCESDDYWTEDHLAELDKIYSTNSEIIKYIINDINVAGKITTKFIKTMDELNSVLVPGINYVDIFNLKEQCHLSFSAFSVDKQLLLSLDFDNVVIPAWLDYWLQRQILARVPVYYLQKKLTNYRVHDSSYSCSDSSRVFEKYKSFFLYVNKWFLKNENQSLFEYLERIKSDDEFINLYKHCQNSYVLNYILSKKGKEIQLIWNDRTLQIVKTIRSLNKNNIYLYCANNLSAYLYKVLEKNGLTVKQIFDKNGDSLKSSEFLCPIVPFSNNILENDCIIVVCSNTYRFEIIDFLKNNVLGEYKILEFYDADLLTSEFEIR